MLFYLQWEIQKIKSSCMYCIESNPLTFVAADNKQGDILYTVKIFNGFQYDFNIKFRCNRGWIF